VKTHKDMAKERDALHDVLKSSGAATIFSRP
jgi:hypothetical protein